ncbi:MULTISPECIES: acyl-CoA dehydrogenase [Mycolicibacterium]|uniref:Acyl-CoA dehydrogenase n=3 Tax=Mycolicibacterium TaxID=1866885 RepID=A0AAE4VH13_MYCFO|nr:MULTISPECIES: acyl-CoA dehydrogenase [Mycolicibacterium]MCV7142490.1 acyl-CoA dehydrogenase [Mycolicibacterium fortuitum]MDV7193412.1 acyl-CoA dehydrogenase [Mycolicibacterium fortuitum]MDV7206819.1 acyl-CoA dehydrogenase [Mycolicibacterium fortuitum]MDV7228337.1 acyl-CoA dehydrogenase [Mycolicibacterium fortuitum]MDV7260445.1 acyl-CoA dehydrogenase [Mycolicibacterium fortuitum]
MSISALAIVEEHHELAEAAVGQLSRHKSRATARATLDGGSPHPIDLWEAAAALGWHGLAISEEHGGSGFGIAELAIVLEAMGHELCPGPFLPTATAALVIDRCGTDMLRAALLPSLASGKLVGAVGLSTDIVLSRDSIANGTARAVAGAPDAGVLVLAAGADLIVVDTEADGVTITALAGLDTSRSIGDVTLHDVELPVERILSGADTKARSAFRILAAAEAVGVGWAALRMATEYVKVREQFGRTIGTFQAVKHHLANMFIAAQQSTAAVWDAARSNDLDDASFAAAVAAAHATRMQTFITQKNIQLHGGIGYTWEHDAHLYLRRAQSLTALIGDTGDALADITEAQRTGAAHGVSFTLPAEADRFRREAAEAAARLRSLPSAEQRDYLVDSGYLVPHWPKPWGRQAGVVEQLVIDEEFAADSGVDLPDLGITGWVMLTIAQAGTDDQRARWVEPVLRGQTNWCQLFSEPGAGSDAAAVRTTATRVDGGWRVTGQKVWTSLAHECQWGLATVRTDPDAPKHAGVTMMAIDMSAPGVRVLPLRELTGEALFNEVFLDDVFVPDNDVVGDVNRGWLVARATLGNERVSIGGGSGAIGVGADDLIKLLDNTSHAAAARREHRVGEVIAELHALRLLNLRNASRAIAGGDTAAEANVSKLLQAESSQHVSELAIELAGTSAVAGGTPELTRAYLYARCLTIAGGTSEIIRNTIAERLLGLPRDPLAK